MDVISNYQNVAATVRRCAEAAGRDPEDVALMVVSKTWAAECILPIVNIGHSLFGENRIQEALEKVPALPENLHWHLIGHLQKNKARKALPLFHVIETVDSLRLAQQISRIAGELSLTQRIFLQINIGEEPQKAGFTVQALCEQLAEVLALPHLDVAGVMAIPPRGDTPEASRPHFRALRECRDDLQSLTGHALPELSMGMTSDFPIAIAEGATIVRVGSAIFGHRRQFVS